MKSPQELEQFIEPERYELHAAPRYHFETDRRQFFKVLGCGVVVVFLSDFSSAQESGGGGRRGGRGGGQRPSEISAWLHISEDGSVTVFTGKVEVGQNARTSLTQAVAEELRAPVDSIKVVMADTALTPYDAGTFGSRTTPDMFVQLRKMSAAAREALLDLAVEFFKADRSALTVSDGKVSKNGTAETASFGQLSKGQNLVRTATDQSPMTPPREWKVAGTSVLKPNGRDLVTGKHRYTSDIKRPGMLHGKILRPAAFDATLASIDAKAAEAMPGVTVVHDGNFVGVTAPDSMQATKAIEAIHAEWTTRPQPSSAELFDYLKKNAGAARGGRGAAPTPAEGATSVAADAEGHTLRRTYNIAYIAHTPLEPRAAVAEWADGKLTVWTGTQRPFGVRGELAQAFNIPEDRVHVIVPDTGSGYGGKHTGDAAIEAARLAKAAGKPVKLVWTRQEEFTWAYFRPAGVIDVAATVRADGVIASWDFHNYNSGGSAIRSPYDVPGQKSEFHGTKSPLRQGSYRGLAATANHFAREVHMDDLARAVKMDPLAFRLKNLKDDRLRAVLEAAAKGFNSGKAKPAPNHGFGIAGGTEKGSYVAMCAEVSVDPKDGKVKVERVVAAFECGAVVNPEQLKNQVEGSIVMGLGGALFESIEFENGTIRNPHLADYRVPRFSDAPKIEVVLVNRLDLPSAGAGETPIVGIAPAISNAIFEACGVRLHSLPMAPDGVGKKAEV